MVIAPATPQQIPVALAKLLPLQVLDVEQYFGSFVRIDAVTNTGIKVRIRVYLCDWKLLKDGRPVANSDGAASPNTDVLRCLINTELSELVLEGREKVIVRFCDMYRLVLEANLTEYDAIDDLFFAYVPQTAINYSPANGFVTESSEWSG